MGAQENEPKLRFGFDGPSVLIYVSHEIFYFLAALILVRVGRFPFDKVALRNRLVSGAILL